MDFKRYTKAVLRKVGFDVRLVRNIKAYERRSGLEKWRAEWDCLSGYNFKTIVDVGANVGDYAWMIHQIFPEAVLHCFEPLGGCFSQLQKRLQEIPNVCVYNCALGDSSGKISLYANDFSPCSSILEATDALKRDWPEAANAKKEWIKVCRLDDVLSDVHLKPEMLVKIDVQGYEREVIRGGKGILRGSKVVVIEVNYVELYKGEPTFDDIYSEMKNLGFAFRGTVEQEKSRIDHRVIFADAIFENTSERE